MMYGGDDHEEMYELQLADSVFSRSAGRVAPADKGGMRDSGDRPDHHLYSAAVSFAA